MTKKLVKQVGQQVIVPHFQLVSRLLGHIAAEDAEPSSEIIRRHGS